eukprot:CAMPEP_0116948258 /NCGR_PEP_ID=MMETSP0467-20121206/38215_1 /TAXON_ID=283647 /ORGANISM="Mesodinium pulex, Strain SPMC105" /LENGTH=68 /DNA_ID=CAMNT_0004632675 /DNA_START=653 /DNA_END=859 /DNA_ORIENTATION=-
MTEDRLKEETDEPMVTNSNVLEDFRAVFPHDYKYMDNLNHLNKTNMMNMKMRMSTQTNRTEIAISQDL